jgi:hypothetical protein
MRWLSTKTCRRKVDLLWQLVKQSSAGSLESGDTSHPQFTPEQLSAPHVEPSHKLTDVNPRTLTIGGACHYHYWPSASRWLMDCSLRMQA